MANIINAPNNRASTSSDGKAGMYDRAMTSYLKNRSPYNYKAIDIDELKNTKWKYFQKVGMRRPEALSKNSVALNNDFNNTAFSLIDQDRSFGNVMYASATEDKPGRMRDYRTMAAYSEISDALNEICDETINVDENDEIVLLKLKDVELESVKKEEIYTEWKRYVQHYDLENYGWRYFRQFLIEGELYFEQIIHDEYTNEGILGIVNVPADLIDPVYSNIQNMVVKGYVYQKPIFSQNDPKKVEKYEPIPFEENQIVYINNGHYNETKDFIVPYIENARRAYRQLSMTEDAIVIRRLVHAPLRFVFNVDVGRLPVPQAEAYLRKVQSQYWSTKTFDSDEGDIVKKYSPQSTLDSFWFAKRQGQEATTVQEIGGQDNMGDMPDLMFFIKKLYRALGVPTSRLDPEDSFRDGTDILREELKFANNVIRQQKMFAAGLKRGFITHLQLRKMYKEYDLTEENIKVTFNPPSNFHDLRNNQKLELKVNTFNNLIGTGKISTTLALKKVMGWKDKDILANREFIRKDMELEFELAQIQSLGPDWKQSLIDQANAGAPPEGGAAGSLGGGGMGGTSMPPDFGGGEAAIGMGNSETPPNAGVPPEQPIVPEEPSP